MNEELKNVIEQLKLSPQGKFLPCLLLLGSCMTTSEPRQWLIDAINHLQKILSNKQQADLFFMMGTHTVKVINDNEVASLFGKKNPSLEEIDHGLAESIKSLFDMVQNRHMQQNTLENFYSETYQWFSECLEQDIKTNNPSVENLLESLQPLMVKSPTLN